MPPSRPIALNLATIVHRLITNPRGWEVESLCDDLEIADRTYRKYRQLLQEEFLPLVRRGRSLVQEVQDGSVRYLRIVERDDSSEVAPLLLRMTTHHFARRILAFLGQEESAAALEDSFRAFWGRSRMRKRFPLLPRLERDLDRLFHFVPEAPKDYSAHDEVLAVVVDGLVNSRRLRMVYESAAQGEKEHEIEPLTLALYRSGLHLFARYVGHKRVYNFVVDRILSVEVLAEGFSYPSPSEYTPDKFTKRSFGIFFQDRGGAQTSAISVDLTFADKRWLHLYLRERQWAPRQRFDELPDGRLRMRFEVRSMVEVWPWIRQFGEDVEVAAPAADTGAGGRG